MVGGFALNEAGEFVIAGLSPGPYILRAEPLDDAGTDSFFAGVIDVDFRVTFASASMVGRAREWCTANAIEIAVRPNASGCRLRPCSRWWARTSAQPMSRRRPRPSRWTLAGGKGWSGSYPIGEGTADSRQNAPGNPSPALPRLSCRSRRSSLALWRGGLVRERWQVTPRVMVEVGARHRHSKMRVRHLAGVDTEGDAVLARRRKPSRNTSWTSACSRSVAGIWAARSRLRPF